MAIVIDQLENLRRTDQLNRFVKSLAEESILTKTFVVMAVTKDPSYARGLLELNGRTKIRSVGDATHYKWTESQVDQWINFKSTVQNGPALKIGGVDAGTPGFLVDNADEQKETVIVQAGEYCKNLWSAGLKLFQS